MEKKKETEKLEKGREGWREVGLSNVIKFYILPCSLSKFIYGVERVDELYTGTCTLLKRLRVT